MKVISTNIAEITEVEWRGQRVKTGIYKKPTLDGIFLGKEDVQKDVVVDRRFHGGIDKACYLFSADNYPFWQEKYPNLNWNWGMFGENVTVKGLDEAKIRIGNIYKIGQALVQVSQPREPCYKLGIRFNDQTILKEFISHKKPGTYVRILEEGFVQKDATIELLEESKNTLTIAQFYSLLFTTDKDPKLVQLAIANEALPLYKREAIKKWC